MRRILAPLAAMVALFVVGVPVARANVIEISIDTVVTAPEGSVTLLATADTPEDLVGKACTGTARAVNQPSVHPGNDLFVASGDSTILLEDVEREPGAITTAEALLTLAPTVTVSLHMGPDEVFSGGLVFSIGECVTPPTTTTTTTEPPTTTTEAPLPAIVIVKSADPEQYTADGIGHFTIEVTNPGPVNLTDVHVTDDVAVAIDPGSNCPNPEVPDLAVGESYAYDCTVANLDGVSPFTNEATAIGTGPDGTQVTDTDDATVFPPPLATTITQPPPTTTPLPTLPVTGANPGQLKVTSVAGFSFLLIGIALLYAAALIGRARLDQTFAPELGQREFWFTIEPRPQPRTIYIPLTRRTPDR